MSQNSRMWPGSSDEATSWDKKTEKPPDRATAFFSNEAPKNLTEVAQTLAAHGTAEVSVALAFDLVMHDIVEEAREAAGATGAAIALFRDGQLVCRATTGDNAPDLGVRVETNSGLAGECVSTGQMQQCRDTETDPRVNAEACRRLGVRSMLIAPLIDKDAGHEKVFGILQVFSPWPNAFGEREISTLQGLAGRVAEAKRQAETSPTEAPGVEEEPHPAPAAVADRIEPHSVREALLAEDLSSPEPETPRRSEFWSTVLVLLVIGVAVLLGLVIGWRSAVKEVAHAPQSTAEPPAGSTQNPAATSAALPPATSTDSANPANASPQSNASSPVTSTQPPAGGLVVTENGRVIYRAPANRNAKQTEPEQSGSRLIHRVQPEYPEQAREQKIQGPVVLDVQIDGSGAVTNVGVVSGDPLLAEAAVQAVKQWRYKPYFADGRAVGSQTRVTIRFTLPPG